jgi:hypothetical protein
MPSRDLVYLAKNRCMKDMRMMLLSSSDMRSVVTLT